MKIETPQGLADRLIGTAQTCIPEEELENAEDVESFETLAFQCDVCGWWCDVEELNNLTSRNLCEECHREETDDED